MNIVKERLTLETFKKIREFTGKYKPRIGGIKSKSGNDLSEEGPVDCLKQGWRHYVQKTYINEMTTRQLNMRQRNVKKK